MKVKPESSSRGGGGTDFALSGLLFFTATPSNQLALSTKI
jgi:hypothetical protein